MEAPISLSNSVVRIKSTSQGWSPAQPWEKLPPEQLRALGAIVAPGKVLTSAEMVADATYLELESSLGSKMAQAEIIAVDYEANLALLTVKSEKDSAEFFKDTKPLALASPPAIGEELSIFQLEDSGIELITVGTLQSVDVISSFLPNQNFLTYLVKASMQGAPSSFSLPVIQGNALAGILTSYHSEDQISDVLSVDVIARFLTNAEKTGGAGFPSLGVSTSRTDDDSFRSFLKLQSEQGGIYVNKIRKGGAAELAGIKAGDVILSIDGHEIDRRGYYEHALYGSLFWGHIVRGEKSAGDEILITILRDGASRKLKAILSREEQQDSLVPDYWFDRAPNFLVKGGFVFQELSLPLLKSFGKDWMSNAPLNLLEAYENPEELDEKNKRVIFLSGSIPTPATVGYERLRNLILKKVNGVPIDSMKSLIAAFQKPNAQNLHSIDFEEENFTIHLDEAISNTVDKALLQRGLSRLSRAE